MEGVLGRIRVRLEVAGLMKLQLPANLLLSKVSNSMVVIHDHSPTDSYCFNTNSAVLSW